MRSKLVLLLLVILNFSVLPSFAEQRIIVDKIADQTAEELELTIPAETNPGPGRVHIEIINQDNSVAGSAYADYCKSLDGVILWNEPCKGFDEIATLPELETIIQRDELPLYDPAQEPNKTTKNLLAGFAALAVIGAGKKEDEENEKEELEFVEGADLDVIDDEPKWGDLSGTWDHRYTEEFEFGMLALAEKSGSRSPLFARKVADGSYLRAMFGSLAAFIYPVALILGAQATYGIDFQALPPSWVILSAIMVLSTLDAFAGLISASVYFSITALTGHITWRSELMTALGVCILMIAPALIASAIRPLRRVIENKNIWERVTDYALIILITGWTIKNTVSSLNTLAHTQFAITYYADNIGWIVGGALLFRLVLEDIAIHFYPVRLSIATPEKVEQTDFDRRISKVWRFYIFVVIASGFVGWNLKLLIGTLIFFAPTILNFGSMKIKHRARFWYWLNPKGAVKILAMIFVGGFFAAWVQSIMKSPREFVAWSFAILAIPGFLLHIFELLSEEPKKVWKERPLGFWVYKVGGVGVFFLLVLMVKGVDLFAKFKSLIGM